MVDELIHKQIPVAAKRAAADLARLGNLTEKLWARLEQGGFAAEEVLGDWFSDAPG